MKTIADRIPKDPAERDALLFHLLALAERGPAVLYVAGATDLEVGYISPNCLALTGYTAEEFVADPSVWTEGLHPDDAAGVFRALEDLMRVGHQVLEYRFRKKRGEWVWVRDELTVLYDPMGTPSEILGYWFDITARVEAETALRTLAGELERRVEERTTLLETLLREVHHRVKNNLQVVMSLLRLSSETAPHGPARDAIQLTVSRVRSIALVHQLLHQTDRVDRLSLRGYLEALLEQLSRAEEFGTTRLDPSIEEVEASPDVAVPVGLIVTELIANALKHAFSSGAGGTIRVTLAPEPAAGPRSFTLAVSDDGRGMADPTSTASSGIGLSLIKSLARQLGAEARVSSGPYGTRVTVVFQIQERSA